MRSEPRTHRRSPEVTSPTMEATGAPSTVRTKRGFFTAGQFEKATEPLSQALEGRPRDGNLEQMLALAWLNADEYSKAADVLAELPDRRSNPRLQYAYGLALVRELFMFCHLSTQMLSPSAGQTMCSVVEPVEHTLALASVVLSEKSRSVSSVRYQ